MKTFLLKISILAFTLFGFVGSAQALIFDFTATDFSSYDGSSVPDNYISGSITIEGNVVTDIHLTIDSHVYTTAEVELFEDWSISDTIDLVGGVNSNYGMTIEPAGAVTNDFWLIGNFSLDSPSFTQFAYTIPDIADYFYTSTGTLTVRNSVPAPASLLLLVLGLTALGFGRRQKA